MNGNFMQMSEKRLYPAPGAVPNGEIMRLVSAAIVDNKFCQLLLSDPVAAMEAGYGAEAFDLSPAERSLVLSAQSANSLADFAWQIIENYNNTSGNGKK